MFFYTTVPNAKFRYSVNSPNEDEYYLGEMYDKIDEFETQTNPEYSSASIRKVNMIKIL
jgi:hypothetical protein